MAEACGDTYQQVVVEALMEHSQAMVEPRESLRDEIVVESSV